MPPVNPSFVLRCNKGFVRMGRGVGLGIDAGNIVNLGRTMIVLAPRPNERSSAGPAKQTWIDDSRERPIHK